MPLAAPVTPATATQFPGSAQCAAEDSAAAQLDGGKLPWSLAFKPTEPVLGPTRRAIPPVGGVDVSPIVWVALLSFFNEILLGPQGILNLLQRKIDLP